MKLGSIFKEARRKQELTVMEVCSKVGLSKSYYTKVENNKYDTPQYETAIRIATALAIDKTIIDRYYSIPEETANEIVVVDSNELIKSLEEDQGYVVTEKEKQILVDLLNTSMNLKKEGFKPEEMVKIMQILQQFISA